MDTMKVIVYGCGVMGRRIVEALLEKQSLSVVGAVDADPRLVGKDLGSLLEDKKNLGIAVRDDPRRFFSEVEADAVVLATTSRLEEVFPQVARCVEAGLHVVSTCEELFFPWERKPELAAKIDRMAREHGVTVVGTGINPGFLMDTLPLMLTAPCLGVEAIQVTRKMDSAKRRIPFQKKIGTGLSPQVFREKMEQKEITGHVGLLESLQAIAAGLGWKLDRAEELPAEPVVADREVSTGLGVVAAGDVIGLVSVARGEREGRKVITLTFDAHAGVEEEYDEVLIQGVPNIRERILGGVHGDVGTVAVTVNTIPRAVASGPGLKIMKDLPPVTAVL